MLCGRQSPCPAVPALFPSPVEFVPPSLPLPIPGTPCWPVQGTLLEGRLSWLFSSTPSPSVLIVDLSLWGPGSPAQQQSWAFMTLRHRRGGVPVLLREAAVLEVREK